MLFVTFLLSGIVLFLAIYGYSVFQLRRENQPAEIEPVASSHKKMGSFWNKFKKRKEDKSLAQESVEDSHVAVGGVTAKVSPSQSASTGVESAQVERVAPTLDDASSISVVSKSVAEKGVEPSMPKVGMINSNTKSAQKYDDAIPLDQLAAELSSERVNENAVNPEEVDKALKEHQRVSTSSAEVSALIQQEAQGDFLSSAASSENSASSGSQEEVALTGVNGANNAEEIVGSQSKGSVEKTSVATNEVIAQESTYVEKPQKEFKAGINAIEIVAKISSSEAVSRDKALVVYRKYDYLFTRHLGIYGKNTLTHVWGDIEHSNEEDHFDEIAVSLQLADKTGAMTRKESNTFSTLAIEMADDLNKKMVFSMDLDESVEKGRMLDGLARKYDALVVCNIIPKRRKGFRSTDIKSCTKDLKMMPAKNGVFGCFDQVNDTVALRYSLALADSEGEYVPATTRDPFQVDEIVVFLNVPLVKKPAEAFDVMIQDARKLAAWMDGKIVDKHARNMTSRTLDKISEQIMTIEKEMALDGLVPGSELCKKLF
ncbi:MAG: cell division protein ZipA C-terminal FtsZ-binding domain-containing protein [Arenicella sp.]